MQLNEKAYALGNKRSIIREIFEYSKLRATEIGKDKVFDFSLEIQALNRLLTF